MILNSIKSISTFVLSLDVILIATTKWLLTFDNILSNTIAYGVSISGLILTYYTVLYIREKMKGQRLDNELKKLKINKSK